MQTALWDDIAVESGGWLNFANPCAVRTKRVPGAALKGPQYEAVYFSSLKLVGQ